MDASQLSDSLLEVQSKMTDMSEQITKNQAEIQDLLGNHSELEERLKTLGIKSSFIGDDGNS
jgi:predicted  nucleic acid-binding Zn-ribbon protein